MRQEGNLEHIRRQGRKLEKLCLWAAWAVTPLTALYFTAFNHLPGEMTRQFVQLADAPVLPGWVRLLCFLAAMVPGAALIATLLRLRGLFLLYGGGSVFTRENVSSFTGLSRTLFVWAAAQLIYTPLCGLAVTAANAPGRRMLVLGVGGAELALLFVAAVAVIIARVMDEARRLDEEQSLTI